MKNFFKFYLNNKSKFSFKKFVKDNAFEDGIANEFFNDIDMVKYNSNLLT